MRSIPFLVIGPMAGVFADRIDRRKMVLVTQSAVAVVVLCFAVAVHLGYVVGTTGVIYALVFSFITGVLHSLIQPVRQAMVANTVPREDLWNAIALNSVAGNVARVVGPGLGGVLIAWLGPALNFYIEGVFYFLMVLAMVPIALPYREAVTATRTSMLANLKQGFRYVLSEQVVLRLLLVACVSDILLAPVIHLMPVIATDVLGRGLRGLWIPGAGYGCRGDYSHHVLRYAGRRLPQGLGRSRSVDAAVGNGDYAGAFNLVMGVTGRHVRLWVLPAGVQNQQQHPLADHHT